MGAMDVTVTHYDFTFDLTSRAATAAITATVTTAGNCLSLPFRATNLGPSVLINGVAASGSLANGSLTLCGAGYNVDDVLTIDASMTVALQTLETSQVGYSTTTDSDGNAFTYMMSWVSGCDQFAPCDSRPDQFATYHFTVTHDPATMVRCSGVVTEPDTSTTVCDFPYAGGPTYSTFALVASPAWTITDKGMWGDVHATVYDRASTGVAAAIDSSFHSGFIQFMESNFGPYPYGTELRILTGPTYWAGFEHPGNIVLSDTIAKMPSPLSVHYANNTAHTLNHEMAHMWAGDQTTLKGTYDFAWKESMAEYLSYVYEDENAPSQGPSTGHYWYASAVQAAHYPVPTDNPALYDFYGDVYGPGPITLFRQLEVITSRDQVMAAIKDLLGTQRAISVDDVQTALEAHTQLDLGDYFSAWVRGAGAPTWPTIATLYTPGTNGAAGTLNATQANISAGAKPCMFHVALNSATTGQSVSVLVDLFHNVGAQTISVPDPGFTVATVVLDPDYECLVFPAPPANVVAAPPKLHPRGWSPWRVQN